MFSCDEWEENDQEINMSYLVKKMIQVPTGITKTKP